MQNQLTGFLNLNKASGMTAHDVVARVRKLCKIKQVGHTGTLDPMARGVLPVALGRACRLIRFLEDDKIYLAGILFGQETDTDDIEGKVIKSSDKMPSAEEIKEALKVFEGDIEQLPPLYSAVHVDGERLYKLARKGETAVEIPKRQVHIHSIEELDYLQAASDPVYKGRILKLRIHCSSGTYIRSIARDLGKMLNSAACLHSLLRERAGTFDLKQARSLEELKESIENSRLNEMIEAPESRLALQKLEMSAEQCKRLSFGQMLLLDKDQLGETSEACRASGYILATLNGKAAAVCRAEKSEAGSEKQIVLSPEVVLINGNFN
ncbi:MAG: tRNA pseudouridine(55) synthase TruB [Candidatus Obscuribacterales bacterium]|nr:tRNA pseudouridine(55) synthase TruB [Candidatus Obscuribacterales bacterium]